MKRTVICFLCITFILGCLSGCKSKDSASSNVSGISSDEAVDSKPDYEAFVGSYQDKVSQRGVAIVTENEDMESCYIEVSWANSAFEAVKWQMNAVWKDEKLSYTDCRKGVVATDEFGESVYTSEYKDKSGYFTFDGKTGNLAWDGAYDEDCRDCVFVRIDNGID